MKKRLEPWKNKKGLKDEKVEKQEKFERGGKTSEKYCRSLGRECERPLKQ